MSWPADGENLVPLFRGEPLADRTLYFYLPLYDLRWGLTPCAIVREGDWKLIDYFGDSFDAQGRYVPGARVELFNLREDVGETNDLANRHPERAAAMHGALRDWIEQSSIRNTAC